jgi:serine phosphatase RsbU (regulator of sigma subunit)
MRIAHAGHPPALVVDGAGARFIELAGDPLLGIDWAGERHEDVVDLHTVEAIILYSDGMVETRRRDLGAGMEQLRSIAAEVVAGTDSPAAQLAVRLVDDDHEDDVTTLVIHRRR